MENLKIQINPKVEAVFNTYPAPVQKKLLKLRNLIIETAKESEDILQLEETLKWGEPSYLAKPARSQAAGKKGSTLRIDWKKKAPDQYAMYFQCGTKLVPTFKTVYKGLFQFEGNRAIVFQMDGTFPENELKKCIHATLIYHTIKHLPMLGL